MLRAATWGLVAILVFLPGLASAYTHHELIVPSEGIGPFRLGMTASAVQTARRQAICAVTPAFKDGKVNRLETNCGGAFHTAEWVQVGGGPGRAVWFYGDPDRVINSDGFDYRAEWLHYNGGIAFRVVYASYGTAIIQAIAVFPGTGRLQVRQTPPPAEVPSIPGVGE